jgi:hypothetical protein
MVNFQMSDLSLPATCDMAFKEWSGICAAIKSGQQSMIVRKGGILEGPAGFTPEYYRFWLYPTHVHEMEQGLKLTLETSDDYSSSDVVLDTLVEVRFLARVDDWNALLRLDNLHIWTEATLLKRFEYRKPGLWVLGIRAYVSPAPSSVEITPAQLGCKTWVTLESPLSTMSLKPVKAENESLLDLEKLKQALGQEGRSS